VSIRAFIALPIDEAMRSRIAETAAGLRAGLHGLRWVEGEAAHLTLRFLGPSSPESLASLEGPLREAAAACSAAEARFAGLGTFPERGAPRVLWLGVSLSPDLLALQAACDSAALAAGFPRESRRFHAHVTLGRWRKQAPRPTLPPVDLGATALRTLVLFGSDLKPTGPLHTPLVTFRLGSIPNPGVGAG